MFATRFVSPGLTNQKHVAKPENRFFSNPGCSSQNLWTVPTIYKSLGYPYESVTVPQSLALITNVIGFLVVLFKSLRWCLGRNGLKWLVFSFLTTTATRNPCAMRQILSMFHTSPALPTPLLEFWCSHSVASLSKVCRTWQTASPWPDFNLPIPPGTLGHGIRLAWPVMVDL